MVKEKDKEQIHRKGHRTERTKGLMLTSPFEIGIAIKNALDGIAVADAVTPASESSIPRILYRRSNLIERQGTDGYMQYVATAIIAVATYDYARGTELACRVHNAMGCLCTFDDGLIINRPRLVSAVEKTETHNGHAVYVQMLTYEIIMQ